MIAHSLRSMLGACKRKGEKLIKATSAFINTRRDGTTGFLYQIIKGEKVFLRSRAEYLGEDLVQWLCEEIYFKYYLPSGSVTVVDIGAGLGQEAIYLYKTARPLNYYAIEIQPSIYECLSCTFYRAGCGYRAMGVAISESQSSVFIQSSSVYQVQRTVEKGFIEIPTIPWEGFQEKYKIQTIDLLKVNIEGGEVYLLPSIADFSNIKRVIVSAHDFRADQGDGEYFRTRAFVTQYLIDKGYQIKSVGDGWLKDWIYGERL